MDTFRTVTEIISGLIAVLAALFSVVAVITLLKYKTESTEKVGIELKKDYEDIKGKLSAISQLVAVHTAEHKVIYEMLGRRMDGMERQVEDKSKSIERRIDSVERKVDRIGDKEN